MPLARWQEARADAQTHEPPPAQVSAKADQFARSVWILANEHAQEEVKKARRSAELAAQTAAAELAHAQDEIGRLERECDRLEQQLTDARHTGERERAHVNAQAHRIQQLEADCSRMATAMENARQQAQTHLVRAAALEGECASLKAQMSEVLNRVGGRSTSKGNGTQTGAHPPT